MIINKNSTSKLNNFFLKKKLKYGFLVIEYKSSAFYWELVRIMTRTIIMISLTYLESSNYAKRISVGLLLILLILF